MPVLPHQIARGGVNRLEHVAGIPQKHHAVVDQRRGLVDARLHDARPDKLQRLDVRFVDPVERAVAPGLIVAAIDQPILWFRRPEDLVGDRDEVRHGAHGALGRRRLRGRRRLGVPQRTDGTEQCNTQQ